MLAVQEYLLSGKTLHDLTEELGINVYHHPSLPLVGLKYSQIDSPKTHHVVRSCRGTVLEKDTWRAVGVSFNRFYNAGEDADEFRKFNWSNFTCNSKEDGSLIIGYHYDGQWRFNTSGSFGLGEVPFSGLSWYDLFRQTNPNLAFEKMDPEYTYIFELCTPWNKVVRRYPESTSFLLSAIHVPTLREMSVAEADALSHDIRVRRPENYHFSSMDEIAKFLERQEETDRTFEGVIIRDDKDMRWKIKTKTYTALHHLHDNGNLFNPKRLVPLLLAGEAAEIVAYFPEGKEAIEKVEGTLNWHYDALVSAWRDNWEIESQKDFAIAIRGVVFSSLLFTLRKLHGKNQTEDLLKAMWRSQADLIAKKLYD